MNIIVKRMHIFLAAAYLVAWCAGGAEDKNRPQSVSADDFLFKIEFIGAQPGKPWYRVGLASAGKEHELSEWRSRYSLITNYYLISVISSKEVSDIRDFLAAPQFLSKRIRIWPSLEPQYVIHVVDRDAAYYLPIGFSADTLRTLNDLKSRLSGEASESLSILTKRISFLDTRQQLETRKDEQNGK